MPTCPGCAQRVDHDRLDVHERYCDGLDRAEGGARHAIERLERRVEALEERLDGQADGDEGLRTVEQSRGGRLPPDRM